MSNTTQGGLRWRRSRDGSAKPTIEIMDVADNYGTAIFKGDPVKLLSDGSVAVCGDTDALVFGVADGVEQYWDGTYLQRGNYLPASTRWGSSGTDLSRRSRLRVILAKGQIFECDLDDSAAAYDTEAEVRALIGENTDHTVGTGSTTNGKSACVLDASDHATTAAQWRIVGVSERLDQDFTASRIKMLVEVNEGTQPPFTTSGV